MAKNVSKHVAAKGRSSRRYFVRTNFCVPIFTELLREEAGQWEVRGYSVGCPEGEVGLDYPDNSVWEISREDFASARRNGWDVGKEEVKAMIRRWNGVHSDRPPAARWRWGVFLAEDLPVLSRILTTRDLAAESPPSDLSVCPDYRHIDEVMERNPAVVLRHMRDQDHLAAPALQIVWLAELSRCIEVCRGAYRKAEERGQPLSTVTDDQLAKLLGH